jgi:hypothetical protein
MEEMKVKEYGRWTMYIHTKLNEETFCNCFKRGREGLSWGDVGSYLAKYNVRLSRNVTINPSV